MSEQTKPSEGVTYCGSKPCGCVVRLISGAAPKRFVDERIAAAVRDGLTVTAMQKSEALAAFEIDCKCGKAK